MHESPRTKESEKKATGRFATSNNYPTMAGIDWTERWTRTGFITAYTYSGNNIHTRLLLSETMTDFWLCIYAQYKCITFSLRRKKLRIPSSGLVYAQTGTTAAEKVVSKNHWRSLFLRVPNSLTSNARLRASIYDKLDPVKICNFSREITPQQRRRTTHYFIYYTSYVYMYLRWIK